MNEELVVVRVTGTICDTTSQSIPTRDEMDRLSDEIANELDRLRSIDPSVTTNLLLGEIEVQVSVEVADSTQIEAAEAGFATIRAAIHAAGIATPRWDISEDHSESSVAFLLREWGGTLSNA